VYPIGLEERAAKDLKGVFPATSREACCYLSKRNRLTVEIPSPARTMTLAIEVPAVIYRGRRQGITVQFPAAPPQHRPLAAGSQSVSFDVPSSARGHSQAIDLVTDTSFIPAKMGLNNDTTEYTVLLRSVAFAT
jgi:hypothetical protein